LINSGFSNESIFVTGNTVIDALLHISQRLDNKNYLEKEFHAKFPKLSSEKKIILVTGHRRENFGKGFARVCNALRQLASRSDIEIVY
ncbi:MAG TPA: UDP-N-acetylglucosamine 2-epimerase (non-hydrolyzing), partial [Rhodospirillales bacterium]|nr:UDP-N-acetylglucosamine 2-epimerase (non-hydrolyzing) [Rhodospirillales bacterium]